MRYVSLCIILFASEHFCSFSTVLHCVYRRLVTLSQYSGVATRLCSEQNRSCSCEIAQLFLGCTTEKQETSLLRIQLGQHKSLHVFTMVIYSVLLDSNQQSVIHEQFIWTVHFPRCRCRIQVVPCSVKLCVVGPGDSHAPQQRNSGPDLCLSQMLKAFNLTFAWIAACSTKSTRIKQTFSRASQCHYYTPGTGNVNNYTMLV